MPNVYNASDKPAHQARAGDIYDFTVLRDIVLHPGLSREVSTKTMQGFTRYILSVYQSRGYGGIYVYIAAQAIQGEGRLQDGLLPVEVVEAKIGQVANKKKLDYFVELLNLNPDRYVSAVISRGSEPKSLALAYDVYESNPWHFFIQVDNSGTKERQWAPRVGMVNTNLTGTDDIPGSRTIVGAAIVDGNRLLPGLER